MFNVNKKYRVRSGAVQSYHFETLEKDVLFPVGTEMVYLEQREMKVPKEVLEGWLPNEMKNFTFNVFQLSFDNTIKKVLVPLPKMMVKEKDTKEQKYEPYDNSSLLMFETVLE